MKVLIASLGLAATVFLVAGSNVTSSEASGPLPPQQIQTIPCSSDDMKRHSCEADTRGGVQLIKQHSEATCTFGRTWGYDDRGIWVDRGCRADFQLGKVNWSGWDQSNTVYCASDDMDRTLCPTNTSQGVRLARQRSDAECIYGRTWGYNRRAIWVDRGCRADFELGQAGWSGGDEKQMIRCSSDDMRLRFCRADTSRGVRLLRQRGDADCLYAATWGYDDRGIWVDRGCRADFQLGGIEDSEGDDQPVAERIYCASDDMHRHTCYANARGGVRLMKKRSDADCIEGRTWGYSYNEIWVDRGCRAEFEVSSGSSHSGGGTVTSVYCASDDMHRHTCPADTRGGVQLKKQHSEAKCVEGTTWGYDRNGIWVDRGCRADFEVRSWNDRRY